MLSTLLALTISASGGPIHWIEDDWSRAKAEAIATNRLVAIDVWATWCHTCLSMNNFVLPDAALKPVAGRHIYLSLDYDNPKNAAFFERHTIAAFPTFMVVDPKSERVVARWLGSGTSTQMAKFFGEAGLAVDPGQEALAGGDYERALKYYEGALKDADAKNRARLLAGYIEALWKGDPDNCAERALPYIGLTDDTAPGIDYVAMTAYCARDVIAPLKQKVMRSVRDRLTPLVSAKGLALSDDDISSLHQTLIDAYETLGETKAAEQLFETRLLHLESAAAASESPEARATFDAHRLGCYLSLGRYDTAEKMLKASEAAMPKDFNHPWRLAVLYQAKKEHNKALKAIDRAISNGYGPRRLRLYSAKIGLQVDTGDMAGAHRTLAQARSALMNTGTKRVRSAWVAELDRQAAKIQPAPSPRPR